MNRFKYTLITVLTIVLSACGASDENQVVETVKTITGDEQRTIVNKSISITGSAESVGKEPVAYEWKKGDEILATTQTLNYLPTEVGIHLLSFRVLFSDSSTTIENIIVIVTKQEINTSIPDISDTSKREFLNAVNQARAVEQNCGTKGVFPATTAISWNDKLYKASYEHIQDLIASKTFEHEGSGTESDWSGYTLGTKSTQQNRVENYGYSWERLAENLAGGDTIDSAEKAVEAWLESDNHCENLMNPLFKEMGMTLLTNEETLYVNYWGQNFGTPK